MTDYRGMDSYPHLKSVGTTKYIPYDRKWHNEETHMIKLNQDNLHIHPKKLPKLLKQLEEIKEQRKILLEQERIYDEIVNGDENSVFYGLKTPSKYTIIKYIADKFNVCDDIADMIYKKFTQKLLTSEAQIGDTRCHDTRVRRQINCNNSDLWRFLRDGVKRRIDPDIKWMKQYDIQFNCCYKIPLLSDDVKLVFYGLNNYFAEYQFKDDTKKGLIELCDKFEIDYKKSWKKDKIKNSILEFVNEYSS